MKSMGLAFPPPRQRSAAGAAGETATSPAQLAETIETYLADHPAAALLEDGRVLFDMRSRALARSPNPTVAACSSFGAMNAISCEPSSPYSSARNVCASPPGAWA